MDAASPAASSLETALVAFVQAHEVVMMHEAKPQVAAGKNAQIDVRVAKLREEWIANESKFLIAFHPMICPLPRDAMIGEANAQRVRWGTWRINAEKNFPPSPIPLLHAQECSHMKSF